MDREPEELQFMGFVGICKESYKLIFSWKKIFSQITLALILPLSFIFLAQIQLSEFLYSKILHNQHQLNGYRTGTPTYNRIRSSLTSEWITFWLFKALLLIFILILSLLSTSAIVYTIACIYASKLEMITFTKIMTVVPKVWKRLMVTFLWSFAILFVYNALVALVAVLFLVVIPQQVLLIVILVILFICYLIGFVCISVIWQLASVVSVLEDMYGIKAMTKSKDLIKGKMWVASVIFLKIQACLTAIQMMFKKLVVVVVVVVVHADGTQGGGLGIGSRVGYGLLCFVLLSVLIHIGLVIQTVIYFVCKSYHHENIDKSCLADHLEAVYLGEYLPLMNKDVQLESIDV